MNDLTISHNTDAATLEGSKVAHTTDSDKKAPQTHIHTTNAFVRKGMVLSEKTAPPVVPAVNRGLKPEISKNPTVLLSLGEGLSTRLGFLTISTWNTPGRPAKPKVGTIGFNSQTQSLELWDGSNWYTTSLGPT